jgi:hypothetical protein
LSTVFFHSHFFIYLFILSLERKRNEEKNGIWVCQRIKEREERERERSNSLSQILLYFFVLRHLKNKMKIKRLCVCVWQIFFCCSFFFSFCDGNITNKNSSKSLFCLLWKVKKTVFLKKCFCVERNLKLWFKKKKEKGIKLYVLENIQKTNYKAYSKTNSLKIFF